MEDTGKTRTRDTGSLRSIRVALVGLGKIGFQNDLQLIQVPSLTHYATLSNFSEVSIVAGIDSRRDIREEFTARTGIHSYATIAELKEKTDLIIISAPTISHLELIKETVEIVNPKMIVCEKPMGSNSIEALEIVALTKAKSISLYVPYLRRYMPHIKEIAEKIKSKQYGEVVEVSVEYGQGLLTNGSHFVNLVDFLVAGIQIELTDILRTNTLNPSWTTTTLGNASVKFQGSCAQTRSGEIRVRCESGEFVLSHGGIITYSGPIDPVSGWLEMPSEIKITDWRWGMQDFYNQVLANFKNGIIANQEDVDSAIRTQQIVTQVLG